MDLITISNSQTIKIVESYQGCWEISPHILDSILAFLELRARKRQLEELY